MLIQDAQHLSVLRFTWRHMSITANIPRKSNLDINFNKIPLLISISVTAELYAKEKINELQHRMLKDKTAEHCDQSNKPGSTSKI